MQAALVPFQEAYATGLAQPVAEFLSPVPPAHDPGRLYDFYRASNDDKIEGDVRYALKYNKNSRMSPKESGAWVDIIVSYWRAVKEIIKADEAANQGRLGDRQYVLVYDTWKDLTSNFIKHISSGLLPPWSIFTLYFTANHLRKIAIRADEQLAKSKPVAFSTGFSDDVVSTVAQNQKLEEAARVFNRIFALCLGDRCISPVLFSYTASNQLQKSRSVRVSQVGCVLHSQSPIQNVFQGNTSHSVGCMNHLLTYITTVESHQSIEERRAIDRGTK